jgi:hypothetical protein
MTEVEEKILRQALDNSNRKLNEANARIVEFEDIKKGHLQIQKEMKERYQELKTALEGMLNARAVVEVDMVTPIPAYTEALKVLEKHNGMV